MENRPEVMQYVFCSDGLSANSAFSKSNVFRYCRVSSDGIPWSYQDAHRMYSRYMDLSDWWRRAGNCIHRQPVLCRGACHSSSPLGVIHVDGTTVDRRQCIFQEATLVQGVCVQLDLEVKAHLQQTGRYRLLQALRPSLHESSVPNIPPGAGLSEILAWTSCRAPGNQS